MKKGLLILIGTVLLTACTMTTSSSLNPVSSSDNNASTNSFSTEATSSSLTDGTITINKSKIIGLINNEYEIEVENTTNEQLFVLVGDSNYSLMNVKVSSSNKVKVDFLSTGSGYFVIRTLSSKGVRVDVESLDLSITNGEDHIDVGETLQVSLSKNVDAKYEVSNSNIASVSENGLITSLKKGTFDLVVTYGEIVLVKTFDSYERSNTLTNLNRNSDFIKYHGRNVHENGYVIMNNTASGFEVTFYGTKLIANLDAWYGTWYGNTQISVLIDGEKDTTKNVIVLNKGTTKYDYVLASGLENKVHTIKVLKRTEALSSSMTLYGLKTDGYFKPVDKTNKLKIEAYGDSITAGYGNLRPSSDPDGTNSTIQSGLQTYATYTAWELDADINVQARSGIGMYTSSNVDEHVNHLYNKVNYDGEYNWNFNNYIPDLVIINLGTNDFWDANSFNLDTFKNEYVNTAVSIAKKYGENTSFILASGLMENNVNPHLESIKQRINEQVKNSIHIVKFDQCVYGHPLASEHKKASEKLVNYIKENNLNVIHTQKENSVELKEIENKNVLTTINVELMDDIPSYCDIYLKGLGEDIKLEKIDTFKYQTKKTLKEGDYKVIFNINNNNNYQEYESEHIINVRDNNSTFNLKLDSFLSLPDEPVDNVTYGWKLSAHAYTSTFNAESENKVTVYNKNWLAGFDYKKASIKNNYKLSAFIKSDATIDENTFIGMCPYYVDDLNYIVVYLQWLNSNGTYVIKSVGCTGIINGNNIGFNDYWNFANINIDLTSGFNFETYKNGTQLTVKINNVVQSQTFYMMEEETTHYALWCYADQNVYYSNINQTSDNTYYKPSTWAQTTCANSQSYNVKSDNEIELNNENNWLAGFIIRSTQYRDNYSLEATITAEQDSYPGDKKIGLVPLYIDSNNFIVCYLQWNEAGLINSIVLTGLINGKDIGFNDIWDFSGTSSSLTKGNVLKISRSNTVFTVTYGDKTFSKIISRVDGLSNYAYGVWCIRTGKVNYSNISIKELI